MQSYEDQRRERLTDVIFDYIQDENTSARQLYLDIRNEIESTQQYHRKYVDKCDELMDHLNGFRDIDLNLSDSEETNYQINANSPYNDGWTQQLYKDYPEKTEENTFTFEDNSSVGVATSSDWSDFWGDDHIRLTDC